LGHIGEFSLTVRLFLKGYPWRRLDPVPWTPLRKPLSESRLALVSSAAFTLPDQKPFDESALGGDPSFRDIPSSVDTATLIDTHRSRSFDQRGMRRDPNLAFPIDRVCELAEAGRMGSVNARHLSFMGSITAPGRLMRHTAPEVARGLVQDGVDVALLVPV
jgi:D-proline reductase (dithiol) PrdB